MIITREEINSYNKITRLNLINSIAGYKQPSLIGTKGNDNIENLAIFSSVTHIGSNPPLLGFITRPNKVPRNTYQNIKERGIYSINMVNKFIIDKAHQTSAKYPKNISEFDAVGLTSYYSNTFDVPLVKESSVSIIMEFLEEYHIKANDTIMVIGEIKEIYLPQSIIEENGQLNLQSVHTIASSGLNTYHEVSKIKEMPYARP